MNQFSTRQSVLEGFSGLLNRQEFQEILITLSESDLMFMEKLLTERLIQTKCEEDRFTETEIRNFQSLTSRENQVLTLIARGYTRPEVADVLQISPNTAATHISSIYRKLDISSVAEATLHACRWGLII